MGTIIYFYEDAERHSAVRFVKSYRTKGIFHREKIVYSLWASNAHPYTEKVSMAKICERIMKDFPNALIFCTDYAEFDKHLSSHLFWAVCKWSEKDGLDGFYSCTVGKKNQWTADIEDAQIELDRKCAEETANTLRKNGERISVMPVYLSVVNDLLNPAMMITCTSKGGKKETKYFARQEDNRIRLVQTSDAARKFTYQEALETFEHLQATNKNFLYAVLPKFKDNVNCRDIERYMHDRKVSRMVSMTTKIKWLNR